MSPRCCNCASYHSATGHHNQGTSVRWNYLYALRLLVECTNEKHTSSTGSRCWIWTWSDCFQLNLYEKTSSHGLKRQWARFNDLPNLKGIFICTIVSNVNRENVTRVSKTWKRKCITLVWSRIQLRPLKESGTPQSINHKFPTWTFTGVLHIRM